MRNRLFFLLILFSVVSCGSSKNRVSLLNNEPLIAKNIREFATSDSCISKDGSFDKCIESNSIPALDWIYMGESNFAGNNYSYISNPRIIPSTNILVFNYLVIENNKSTGYKIRLEKPGFAKKFNCKTFEMKYRRIGSDYSEIWRSAIFPKKPIKNFEDYKKSIYFKPVPRAPDDPPNVLHMMDVAEKWMNEVGMKTAADYNYICRNLVKKTI